MNPRRFALASASLALSAVLLCVSHCLAQQPHPSDAAASPATQSALVDSPGASLTRTAAPARAPRPGGAANNFRDFAHRLGSPLMPVGPAISAAIGMYTEGDSQFGSGAEGYGNRYAVAFGDQFNGKFLRYFAMPTMFNQVEGYVPLGRGYSADNRIAHAFAHSFVTRTRNGHRTINMSGIPASAAMAAIGNGYYPDRYTTASYTLRRAGYAQAAYFAGDLWSEFAPQLCHALHLPCGKKKN